ncbi:MAG: (2Fe-2S)-binding protein [Anaerolineae bacterium]|nr:(2Fe-2S)-binding protein [Anaerolineae bacterium]
MPEIEFDLNGKKVVVDVAPGDLLADVLRDKLGITGVKVGCGEGECGACTVLVDDVATLSCIYPALKVQGRRVLTIEGLGNGRQLHVIQQAFVESFAAQCGYCTPGMIMAAKALLDENPKPSRKEIMAGISGNICRCTGYYQIIDAIELAARRLNEQAPGETEAAR